MPGGQQWRSERDGGPAPTMSRWIGVIKPAADGMIYPAKARQTLKEPDVREGNPPALHVIPMR